MIVGTGPQITGAVSPLTSESDVETNTLAQYLVNAWDLGAEKLRKCEL